MRGDSGGYKCAANNKYGHDTKIINLLIQGKENNTNINIVILF